jgi:D-glycero-alpha-D-manno-heptose-7-phosphate kinase
VISTSIAKYVYIFVHPYLDPATTLVKYSQTEMVQDVRQIRHPLVRQALLRVGLSGLDINSIADIPGGTGLGSSSSFTVALLHALYAQRGVFVDHERLAREACEIEIEELGAPIGKQDQYAAAYGGLNKITFLGGGDVKVEPIALTNARREEFHRHLMIFYTGQSRDANSVLLEQNNAVKTPSSPTRHYLRAMAGLVDPFVAALVNGDLGDCGKLLDEGWQRKRQLTAGISNAAVDEAYALGRANGAIGGKLLGAGGGGYILFVVRPEDRDRLREAMHLRELEFKFDVHGSGIIFVDNQ